MSDAYLSALFNLKREPIVTHLHSLWLVFVLCSRFQPEELRSRRVAGFWEFWLISFTAFALLLRFFAMPDVQQHKAGHAKYRYSIPQLLNLSVTAQLPFDLSKFTYEAARGESV